MEGYVEMQRGGGETADGIVRSNNQHPQQLQQQQSSNTSSSQQQPLATTDHLTLYEIQQLRILLSTTSGGVASSTTSMLQDPYKLDRNMTADSEYSEFPETTHAWAVFADDPAKKATKTDRIIGTIIIAFQLFTYALFTSEAIEDYERGVVPVMIPHDTCDANNEEFYNNGNNNNGNGNNGNNNNIKFQCEANTTSNFDAAVAFFMLAVFLTPDILQAARAIQNSAIGLTTNSTSTFFFACLTGIEVVAAFLAASIAISYQLYIGEVTDAIEVGVGLLFIRELSARAYLCVSHKGSKRYLTFIGMMALLMTSGFLIEYICERRFTQ